MKRGFTLLEMVMVLALVGIVALILSQVIYSGMNSWFFIKEQKSMMTDASSAMRRMVREIRLANSITTFASSECQFTDISGAAINYRQVGSNLQRNSEIMLQCVAVNGLQFSYLDSQGGAAASASTIRSIQIVLTTQNGSNRVALLSSASIRKR